MSGDAPSSRILTDDERDALVALVEDAPGTLLERLAYDAQLDVLLAESIAEWRTRNDATVEKIHRFVHEMMTRLEADVFRDLKLPWARMWNQHLFDRDTFTAALLDALGLRDEDN